MVFILTRCGRVSTLLAFILLCALVKPAHCGLTRSDLSCLSSRETTLNASVAARVIGISPVFGSGLTVQGILRCHQRNIGGTSVVLTGRVSSARQMRYQWSGRVKPDELKPLVDKYASKYDLDPAIVYGVCLHESLLDNNAARYEPDYRWLYRPETVKPRHSSLRTEQALQRTSIGLMQVMGAVYREHGYRGWLPALFADVEKQLDYGCRHLASQVKKHGTLAGIAAYNAGSPNRYADGRFVNQSYVDKVLAAAEEYPG